MLFNKTSEKRDKAVAYLIVILCMVIAVWCRSRAFVAGYTAGLLFIYLMGKRLRTKRGMFLAGSVMVLWIGLLAVLFKPDSSAGRLLIYKISFRLLEKNFPWGVGPGNFQKAYLPCQADYFRAGTYTTKELLLADNIRYAYNDYLQIVIEWGVIGIFILLAGSFSLIYFLEKSKTMKITAPLLIAGSQLAALLTAAWVTHVFELLLFQAIAVISLLVLWSAARTDHIKWGRYFISSLLVLLGLTWVHYGGYIVHPGSYKKLTEARELLGAGFIAESVRTYGQLYPVLQNDPSFLNGYAGALQAHRDYPAAIAVLTMLNEKYPSSVYLEDLGNCYERISHYRHAENAYLSAVYMVPGRFATRWSLFNLYILTKQTDKAIWIGRSILALPVKIASPQIDRIKEDVSARMPLQR